MTELAIQIGREGISWAYLPDPLSLDSENVVEGYARVWPRLDDYPGALLPLGTNERLQTYVLITEIAEDADFVLLAFEEGTDLRRVGRGAAGRCAGGPRLLRIEGGGAAAHQAGRRACRRRKGERRSGHGDAGRGAAPHLRRQEASRAAGGGIRPTLR